MLTHSLTGRGLTFQEAFDTASQIRDQLKDRRRIPKAELARLINSIVRKRFGKRLLEKSARSGRSPATILITGQGSGPFSKGILSQSLQATGIDPSVAYDIAREIEAYLTKGRKRRFSRDQLRRLIYETILHSYDAEVAERYLLWRRFKAPDKPLLILFGGATGVGKSTIAAEVSHRLGVQKIVSTDTIRQIMRMMFSAELLPSIHFSSFEAWKERIGREKERRDVAVVEGFKDQCMRILVGVRAMMERAVQESSSLVIDGVHLVPGLMDLEAIQDRSYVVPIILTVPDREIFRRRFPKRQSRAADRKAGKYLNNFESILGIQTYLTEMARRHDTPIIENLDLDDTVSSILTVITQSLRAQLGLSRRQLLEWAL